MKKTKLDKPLLIVMIVFLVFGLIMVLSASSMASYMRYDKNIYDYFIKQAIFILAGLVAFLIATYFPTKLFKKISPFLMFILILSLVGLMFYGNDNGTSQSWYNLKVITIQPSEMGKIIIVLYLANYYNNHKDELDNQWILLKPLILVIINFVLIAMQPDLGTASVIFGIVVMIFYALPLKKQTRTPINKIFLGGILLVVLSLILTGGSFLRDYQLERFNFLNPCERYEEESGYQLCNSLIAFKNGGLTGKGIGESTQKYLYLPESHTDFIFPIIVEEWGLIVGIIIILLYLFILYRILNIAKKATNLGNSIIAYGVFAYLLLHISINLIGVMGIGPLTGVPLPFLSYGGSYMLTLLFAMGLVQRVHYETYKKSRK
ncbi:MAG: FtsW/RodA/SpoVE family cell cycle protein [Erysipelotrichaceae bacterium]|nr:FtsW/RodA/SpoVE family cell cycle protein [Erysipelotrichaceae bacterium]MDD6093861.1 FtsW/RodA/SpoVE family cell cycle protein [bacterium]MDY3934483.1 FtsW/RodA/SpoVE family cell cycle protein [Bacilli bacterium]